MSRYSGLVAEVSAQRGILDLGKFNMICRSRPTASEAQPMLTARRGEPRRDHHVCDRSVLVAALRLTAREVMTEPININTSQLMTQSMLFRRINSSFIRKKPIYRPHPRPNNKPPKNLPPAFI
jgi:hypothetical protein